jgi:hypothetical protein
VDLGVIFFGGGDGDAILSRAANNGEMSLLPSPTRTTPRSGPRRRVQAPLVNGIGAEPRASTPRGEKKTKKAAPADPFFCLSARSQAGPGCAERSYPRGVS